MENLQSLGIIPIDSTKNRILVVDVCYLLPEDKSNGDSNELRESLESEYNCKVFLIDSSKQNIHSNQEVVRQPIYFI